MQAELVWPCGVQLELERSRGPERCWQRLAVDCGDYGDLLGGPPGKVLPMLLEEPI
jgi:hypothetical protein